MLIIKLTTVVPMNRLNNDNTITPINVMNNPFCQLIKSFSVVKPKRANARNNPLVTRKDAPIVPNEK